jgi:chemotaxis protein MotB
MRRFVIIFMFFALCGSMAVLAGCASGVPKERWDELQRMRNQLVKEKEALEARIAELQKQLAGLDQMKAEYDKVLADLNAAKERLTEVNAALANAIDERDRFKAALDKAGFNAKIFGNGVAVPLQGDILFDSGKSVLKESGKKVLQNAQEGINQVITAGGFEIEWIRIDGHTDTDPIKHSGYRDNWDLGSARAVAVMKYLNELGGWDQYKLYVASYADTVPVDTAGSDAAKAKNRRVEIYIVPKAKSLAVPAPASAPSPAPVPAGTAPAPATTGS